MAKTTTTIQHEDTNDVDVRINKRKRIIKEFSLDKPQVTLTPSYK
jgi:hypothetical protein